MQTEYPIMYDQKKVGKAELERLGMYYRIFCHVSTQVPQPVYVKLSVGEQIMDLGLCFLDGNDFVLAARIPVGTMEKETITFLAYSKQKDADSHFIPVCSNKPFSDLTLLKKARFAVVDSKTGICVHDFTGKFPDPPDSDQIPGHPNRSVLQ